MHKKLKFLIRIFFMLPFVACTPNPGGLSSLSSTSTGIDYSLTPTNNYVKYTSPSVMDQSYFGNSMAIGDFNGDGLKDLAAGVPLADIASNTNTGGVLIYNGTLTSSATQYDYYDAFIGAPNTNNNEFGRALAVYDLNADGFDDLVVGAPGEEPSNRGAVYIFNGSSSGLSASPSQILGEPNSVANSGFGSAVAIGDLDDDGLPELVVGANDDDTIAANAGAIWIYKGLAAGIFSSALATQVTAGSAASDSFGTAVAIVDYNADTIPDIVVGAPLDDGSAADMGYFYVFYGTGSAATWVASQTAASVAVANPSGVASDYFGYSLAAGDITGDGKPDLIVGVPYADQYGSNQGLALVYDDIQSNADADAMVPATISAYGTTLSGYGVALGDLNNDDKMDLLIGTPLHSEGAYGSGRIDAYYAENSGAIFFTTVDAVYYPTSSLDGTYKSYDDYFGYAVCSGDLNGDGFKDMIVGSPYDDSKWADDGRVYIYYSRANGTYLNKPDVTIDAGGYRPTSRLYGTACVVMDYNRDGINDLAVGAMGDDFGGTDGGAVFIHYGTGTGVTLTPNHAIIDPGDNSNYFGKSLATGDLNNDGFSDLIVGAYADDTGGADRGIVYVYASNTTTGAINVTPSTFQTVLANSDYFGYSVGTADMDGDGDDDLLVGVIGDDTQAADSGRVVVYLNPGTTNTLLNSVADAYIYHPTGAANSYFGSAIAFNFYSLTTYKDLIIGAYADDTVFTDGGGVYIYQGSVSGPASSSTQSITGLDGANSASEGLGSDLAIFDFNQDGVNDLAIGAYADDQSGQNGGSVYVRVVH